MKMRINDLLFTHREKKIKVEEKFHFEPRHSTVYRLGKASFRTIYYKTLEPDKVQLIRIRVFTSNNW